MFYTMNRGALTVPGALIRILRGVVSGLEQKKQSSKKVALLALLASSLTAPVVPVYAQDALQVMPTRLVMTRESSGELTLINKGSKPGNYRILLRNIRTDDSGKFETAESAKNGERFADEFVRFSPRRVTVDPGSFQKVRVMVRKPKDLADGEYRTHMVFQTLPEQKVNTLDEAATDEMEVAVQTIVEISIPIIIRHGKLTADVKLSAAKKESDKVLFTLNRGGNRSLYGDVEVFLNSGANKNTRIGYARGISVYYPNALRTVELPFSLPEGVSAANQELLVKFAEDKDFGGSLTTELVIPAK